MAQSPAEDGLLDDGEERLRRICGQFDDRIYGVLQSEGHTASKLWASKGGIVPVLSGSIQKVLEDGDKAEELAASIFVFARRYRIARRVEKEKTRDPRLEKWLAEKLEHLPENEFLKNTFHSLKAKPEERAHGHRGREDEEKAMASLKRTYVGNAHETMYDELCTLREEARARVHYSCYTAIVQSSGTGKTRGVLEMSRLGVYICYCSTAAAGSFACPPRSGQLANELSMTYSELDMALYFKAWLSVLVDEAINKKMPPEAWMDSQLHDTCPIRAAVLQRWKEYRDTDGFKKDVSKEDFDQRNLDILEPELRELKERLPDVPRGNLKILLVFDEARGLEIGASSMKDRAMVQDSSALQRREHAIIESPFYQMRRVSRAFFSHKHCFSVAVGTAALMSSMQPNSWSEEQSRKARALGTRLLRPVYQVLNLELVTPTADLSPEKVFRIGRPLWSSRIEREGSMESFISFVEKKLICVPVGSFGGEQVNVYGGYGKVKMAESQAMALLSVTVGLEICPRSDLSRFLVEFHTGIVTFISADGERVHVSHPVEPAVSEAATRILNYCGGGPFVAALERLNHAFLSGYCGSGDRGELACKTLLLMAGWRWLQHHEAEFYLTPIPIRDYLRSLLGLSEDEVASACEGLSKDSYVFFNSFMLVNEEEEVSAKALAAAFLRGCAIHFRAGNQVRAYDFVIPVSTPEGMTFILGSGKGVQNAGSMRDRATEELNPRHANVSGTHGVKVLTIFINVSEPDPALATPLAASKIWKPDELSRIYRERFDPRQVAHMSLYGLERNFRGLKLNSDGRVKEEEQLTVLEKQARKLLLELLVSAPDTEKEAGLFSRRDAEHVRKLVPDVYSVGTPDDAEIRKLGSMAGARRQNYSLEPLKHHSGSGGKTLDQRQEGSSLVEQGKSKKQRII